MLCSGPGPWRRLKNLYRERRAPRGGADVDDGIVRPRKDSSVDARALLQPGQDGACASQNDTVRRPPILPESVERKQKACRASLVLVH